MHYVVNRLLLLFFLLLFVVWLLQLSFVRDLHLCDILGGIVILGGIR